MKITVEIDTEALKQLRQFTGRKGKSSAVSQALGEFLRQRTRREFIARVMSGQTDFGMTNDQLEAMDVREAQLPELGTS